MVDSFVEDVEMGLRRRTALIPVADTLDEMKREIVERLDEDLRAGLITEAQYEHILNNLEKYHLPEAVWYGSRLYHLQRLGLEDIPERDLDRYLKLPIKETLSVTKSIDEWLSAGFTLDDIDRFARLGLIEVVGRIVRPTLLTLEKLSGMPEMIE